MLLGVEGSDRDDRALIGWLLVRSPRHGAVVFGGRGARYLDHGRIEGEDPRAPFGPTASRHLLRTDGFAHVADIMVGSFYDGELDEGCAFEELLDAPIVGAEAVHRLLRGWRLMLQKGAGATRPGDQPVDSAGPVRA